MQEKDRKKLAAVAIMAIIICNYIIMPGIERWQKERALLVEEKQSLDEIPFIEAGKKTEGSLCIVKSPESPSCGVIFNEYIYCERYFEEMEFLPYDEEDHLWEFERFDTWDGIGYRDGEVKSWLVDFYNYRTGELEKTLDLAEIDAQNTPGKQHFSDSYDIFEPWIVDGKRYLRWKVQAIRQGYFDTDETVVYDFDQDKVVHNAAIPRGGYTNRERDFLDVSYILVDSYDCNFMEINGFDENDVRIRYSDTREGMIKVTMRASMLPEENTRLYEEFPELKGYDAKAGDKVELYFAGYPDAEKVMEMLLEEGEEITYEGCVLGGGSTIDGEDHNISCLADYIKWNRGYW